MSVRPEPRGGGAASSTSGRVTRGGIRGNPGDWTPLHPVVPWTVVHPDDAERRCVDRLADELRERDQALGRPRIGGSARPGAGPWPALHIHAGAPTIHQGQPLAREHRALLLARDGDVVVTRAPWVQSFADYCRADLGLGRVRSLSPAFGAPGDSLIRRVIRDPVVVDQVCGIADAHGGLTVSPYLATGGIWAMASLVAQRTGCPVRVAASPPGVVDRVNDKTWFARIAEALLGAEALPPSRTANSWTLLAALVRETAERHASVGIKLPSDAGSAGNLVLDSASLRSFDTLRRLRTHLREVFAGLGWTHPFPTLVSVWEDRVVVSPSVQMWIPESSEDGVVVEGVFHQTVTGRVGRFVGCAPSDLSIDTRMRLAREASLFGLFFQRLGYYGRCSLDAILVGADAASAAVHWVECNGRWGGTSLPMTLANRLIGDWKRHPFVVIGNVPVSGDGHFTAIRERIRGIGYRQDDGEGLIAISPGPSETACGVTLMAIASCVDRARAIAGEGVALLNGTSPTLH